MMKIKKKEQKDDINGIHNNPDMCPCTCVVTSLLVALTVFDKSCLLLSRISNNLHEQY